MRTEILSSERLRHLGAHEKLLHLYSRRHPRHFCVAAELVGRMEAMDFRRAFDAVQRRHPMLRVKIAEAIDGSPAFHRSILPIKVTIVPSSVGMDWKRIVEQELSIDFPAEEEPLMRANVLRDRGGATVVLTFHHAANDGTSGAIVIGDLMKALAGEALDPLPTGPSLEQALERMLADATQAQAIIEPLDVEAIRRIGGAPLWRPFEQDRPRVSAVTLDEAQTARLVERCRANDTTVHGAVSAALAFSMGLTEHRQSMKILNPVDLRPLVNLSREESGLYVGVAAIDLPCNAGSFWERARQAFSLLNPLRSPQALLSGARRLQTYLQSDADDDLACGLVGAIGYDAVVTNLGILRLEKTVGALRLAAFWGPSVQGRFRNDMTIGVATCGGILRLVQTSPPQTSIVADDIAAYLTEACR